jgi:hypothetical protein
MWDVMQGDSVVNGRERDVEGEMIYEGRLQILDF